MFSDLGYSLSGIEQLNLHNFDIRTYAAKSFERAISRGKHQQLWARILGKQQSLETLSSHPVETRSCTSRIVSIPIRQIKGTLGRSADFDAQFNPLKETCRSRWISILTAMRMGITLPPVELLHVGQVYYVRDGHHRISVAKTIGQQAIDARIVN